MSGALRIQVNLPPRELSPNGGNATAHWSTIAGARKEYRFAVKVQALNALRLARWQRPERVRVSLLWCTAGRPRGVGLYAPRDAGNAVAAFKPGFDGLVDAGVMDDDDWAHMWLGDVNLDPASGPFVVVTIEPMPELRRTRR